MAVLATPLTMLTTTATAAVWLNNADGLWTDNGNWNPGEPNGVGAVADFAQLDITADRTVSLDAPRTVGSLIFGDITTATAGSWIINNNSDPANTLTLDNGSSTPTITVNALGSGKSATVGPVLLGTNGLTKLGTGSLTLSGANTISGPVLVDGGTLSISGSMAAVSNFIVRSTMSMNNGGSNQVAQDRLSDTATVTIKAGGTFNTGSGGTNGVTTTETIGVLGVSNGGSVLASGSAGGGAGSVRTSRLVAGSVSRTGNSTLRITAANLGDPAATNTSTLPLTRITITDASSLGLVGTNTANGGQGSDTTLKVVPWMYADNSTTASAYSGIGLVTHDDAVGLRRLGASETITFAASVGDPNASLMNVREVSSTALSASRTVNSFTLQDTGAAATIDLGGNTLTSASGALLISSTTSGNTISNGFLTAGTNDAIADELIVHLGGSTGTPVISAVMQNNGAAPLSVTFAGVRSATISGNNTFTGAITHNATGTATTMSGTNTASQISVNNGTLIMSNIGGLNGQPVVAVNRGATFRFANGANATIAGINDVDGGGTFNANGGSSGTFRTVELNGSGDYSFSGVIQNGGVSVGISKTGSGTQTLAGINAYTGPTAVSNGTLLVNGSIAGGAVTVTGDGILGGQGVIGGLTSITDGTLSPGNSVGTLSFLNNLTLGALSTSLFEIDGLTLGLHDLALGGAGAQSVTFDGLLQLDFTPGFNTPGTAKIFDFETYAAAFASVQVNGLASGYEATFNALTGEVTVEVVPEPAAAFMLTAAAMGLGLRRRRTV